MGGGLLFLWSGYHGADVTGSLRDLLAGKQPSPGSGDLAIGGAALASGGTSPAAGGQYTHAQLRQLWTGNGGDPSAAHVAAAVALAESGGDAGVTSSNPDGGVNVGLSQLDTRGQGAGYTAAPPPNPQTHARPPVIGS